MAQLTLFDARETLVTNDQRGLIAYTADGQSNLSRACNSVQVVATVTPASAPFPR